MKKAAALTMAAIGLLALAAGPAAAADSACITCHEKVSPGIVADWKKSAMNDAMGCEECHGTAHTSEKDATKAALPTPETCKKCHAKQYDGYMAGKHSKGWVAMAAMPTNSLQPHPYISGLKGCGGCHRVGVKPEAEKQYNRYGMGCNSCHTRHVFSKAEASKPQACQTCHMGFDHPQWEMWSTSKHGSIALSTNDTGRAPVCQTCHMPGGDHGVKTAWGFLALRLPEDDAEWMGYRATILKALRVLDVDGKPTARLDVVKAGDVARLTKEAFDAERGKMEKVCSQCHSASFYKQNLKEADAMVKEADKIMAEAIEIVAGLYRDGIIKPAEGQPAYPDLLTFYDATTPVEQTLYVMFLEHRMRAFQGAFHMNPDYVTWYGYAELKKDLVEIKADAASMRAEAKK
ncbi:MAG TPA: multiheme c-type cytochrome [bacterium]